MTIMTAGLTSVIVVGLTLFTVWYVAEVHRENSARELDLTVRQGTAVLEHFLAAQQANLDLWLSKPLVSVFISSPGLDAVSLPGLERFFDRVRAGDDRILTVLLVRNGSIVYDASGLNVHGPGTGDRINSFIRDKGQTSLFVAFQGRLDRNRSILFIKRPCLKNGAPVPGAWGILGLNLLTVQKKLLADIRVGKNGFAALLADTGGRIVAPGLAGQGAEILAFLEKSAGWRTWANIIPSFDRANVRVAVLPEFPLAVAGVAASRDISEKTELIVTIFVFAGCLAMIAGVGGALVISGWLAGPLADLVVFLGRLDWETLEDLPTPGKRFRVAEVAILHDAFKAMVEKMKNSKQEIRDKTERLRAMGQFMTRQRKLLHATLSSIGDGVITTDTKMRITFMNPVAEQIMEHNLASVLNHPIDRAFIIMNEQTLQPVENPIKKVLKRETTVQGMVTHTVLVTGTGREVPVENSGAPILDETGKLSGAVLVFRDITERRRLEEQLRQSQKLESVGQLAGGIAHDYNNMLSVILGYAELAMDRPFLEDGVREDLKEIQAAAQRSADITRQLLAFARKQTVSLKVVDLNQAVASMLVMLRRLIGEDLDLAWIPKSGLWPVEIDPSQLDQILANLCLNARDAISDQGKITIETGMRTFDQEYCRNHVGFIPGDFVMLAVADNGCGMDPHTRSLIFDPFFTTKAAGEGTGLGLSTVFGIIKQNEGFINVYSEPGRGTVFKLYFSRYEGEGTQEVNKDTGPLPAGGGERILVVEDEAATLKMIRRMLTKLGYEVMTADTPTQAIDLAEEYRNSLALLITDVVMPEMNGRDLAGRITALNPGLKILFMSGYTANVIAHHGILDQGIDFIQKPFSKEDLAAKVRDVLSSG